MRCANARVPVRVDVQRVVSVREKTASRVCTAAEQEFCGAKAAARCSFAASGAQRELF
jgi:hypothetical protein